MRDTTNQRRSRRVSDTIRNGAGNADTPVSDTLRESDTLAWPEHHRRVSDTFRRYPPRYAADVYPVFETRAPGVRLPMRDSGTRCLTPDARQCTRCLTPDARHDQSTPVSAGV